MMPQRPPRYGNAHISQGPGDHYDGFIGDVGKPVHMDKRHPADKDRHRPIDGNASYDGNMECMPKMDMPGRDIDSQGGFVETSRAPDGKFADAQGRNSVNKRTADQDGKGPDMPNFPMDFGDHYMEGQDQPFAPYMDRDYMRNMEPMDMRYMVPGRFSLHMENPERYMDLSRFTMDFEGRYMDPNGRLFYPFGRRGSNRMIDMMRPQIPRNEIGDEITEQELIQSGMLVVTDIDYHLHENVRHHHTEQFDLAQNGQLIVRRGQPFMLTIHFNEEYDESKHSLKFIFQIGDNPMPSQKTEVKFGFVDKWYPEEWGAKMVSRQDNFITLYIHPGCDCLVGVWDFMLETMAFGKGSYCFDQFEPIYILFNPWCKGDQIYMDDKDLLHEYVLNDHGHIFQGSGSSSVYQKPWNYGQFDDDILDISLYLMRQGFLDYNIQMSNPVRIVRALAQMMNSPENNGVMMRSSTGDFSDGKKPAAWGGSPRILQQFIDTKEPVRYGQCWVFAALMTTVCRALGIPCRTVTNFNSNHDSDDNVTVNIYLEEDEEGNIYERKENNLWSFHVWNDVWMGRPDLPVGYCGWQTIDPTPQEASDGFYCCGPAPLKALKNGEINQTFDTNFIFSELNSDRVYWMKNAQNGKWEIVHIEKDALGKYIYTKYPHSMPGYNRSGGLMDITSDYKLLSGSEYDRIDIINMCRKKLMMLRAKKSSRPHDMEFRVTDKENVMVGQKFSVTVSGRNIGFDKRTVQTSMYCKIVNHYGDQIGMCKEMHVSTNVGSKDNKSIVMEVNPEDYIPYMGRDNDSRLSMRIAIYCKVKQTDQMFIYSDSFHMDWPYLNIEVATKIPAGQQMPARISFVNPLPIPLTECELMVQGSGFDRVLEMPLSDVPPHAKMIEEVPFVVRKSGEKQLVATFCCRELRDVVGNAILNVFK